MKANGARVLPHNLDAEASILGGVILRNDVLKRLASVEVDDFYDIRHQVVWQAIRNLEANAVPIDVVTLEVEIEKQGKLDAIGGVAFLGELALRVPTADNVVAYAQPVLTDARNRRALLAAGEFLDRGMRWPHGAADMLPELLAQLQRMDLGGRATTPGTFDHELAIAMADVRGALGSSPVVRREPLFIDATELFMREFAAASWLVRKLVTRGGVAMIGGEPKTAKTWLALELAVAIATGTAACGEFFAERGTAAYFFAEDLDKQVRNRLRALLVGRGVESMPVGRLHVCPRGKFVDVTRDEDLAWLVASCRKLGPIDLLVLDPLRDISSAAEDKSDEMSPVMRRLRLLGELLRCTVAVVHHAGKAGADNAKRRPGQRLRGSGAIHGATDSGIYLSDAEGDGQTTFRAVVDSEVKGARSAGRFELAFEVVDDENGEAEEATWRVTREDKADVAAKDQPDYRERVVTKARECPTGFDTKSALLKATGGYRQKVFSAIDAELRPSGRLVLRDGRIYAKELAP